MRLHPKENHSPIKCSRDSLHTSNDVPIRQTTARNTDHARLVKGPGAGVLEIHVGMSSRHLRSTEGVRELEELRRRVQELERQLSAIHTSKMWKVWMWSIRVRTGISRAFMRAARLPLSILAAFGRAITAVARTATSGLVFIYLLLGTLRLYAASGLRRLVPIHLPVVPVSEAAMVRPRLLVVSPYSIYPLHHGGAARLFNLIRHLSLEADVYALIFNRDGSSDPVQETALGRYCREVFFHHWQPNFSRKIATLRPPGARLFSSAAAANRIRDIVKSRSINVVQLEYTELGQYALPDLEARVILVEHDIAFRSFWRRRRLGFPKRYPHSRFFGATFGDWMRMLRYEVKASKSVDQIHAMSDDDAIYLASFLPDRGKRIRVVPNAVDTSYYTPSAETPRDNVLFLGNFENLPNVDAFEFFVREIWPEIVRRRPGTTLSVVGAKMTDSIRRLHGQNCIAVIGEVTDVRDSYHRHAVLAVPLRAGSGTRLKILEAFASKIPVVSTTLGAEGIVCTHREHLLLADDPLLFARSVIEILEDPALGRRLSAAAAELAASSYDWSTAAARNLAGVRELLRPRSTAPTPSSSPSPQHRPASTEDVDISIVIPTLHGGRLLEIVLDSIARQRTDRSFEVLLVDSGSGEEELNRLRERPGIRVHTIPNNEFNHGLTRDLGASLARGEVLVFLNQDAVPVKEDWLPTLTAPLFGPRPPAAVQGGILETDDESLARRFFWDSCGERFYFTRESSSWLARHSGLGFSTVNAAIRRDVWSEWPFGWAPIMEDKKWQHQVTKHGLSIDQRPEAAVYHSHDYDLRSLIVRCRSEGVGWSFLGERYSLANALRDAFRPSIYRELLRGLYHGEVRRPAELFFPWLRPLALWLGNRSYRPFRV